MRTLKTKGGGKENTKEKNGSSKRPNPYIINATPSKDPFFFAFDGAEKAIKETFPPSSASGAAEEKLPREAPPPMELLSMPSASHSLRSYKGTTSCRHFLILIIVTDVADEYYVFIYENSKVNPYLKRTLISKIWRQTLENTPDSSYKDLKQFFSYNNPTSVDRVEIDHIDGLTATGSVILLTPDRILQGVRLDPVRVDGVPSNGSFDFLDGKIYPMAITNSDGKHIFHYFSIMIEGDRVVIYSAYGSDYLRAHPARVEITFAELDLFIRAGIVLQTDPQDAGAIHNLNVLFIKFFTQHADKTVSYLDEGLSPARYVTIDKERGIQLEIEFYVNGYRVVYFPTVTEGLRSACRDEVNKKKGPSPIQKDQRTSLRGWLSTVGGGNKKRSNRRITRRKITRRNLRRYSRPKN